MFSDRFDAADQLATEFARRQLVSPLVLSIPRGGVIVGTVLAQHLRAELDVVVSVKLDDPRRPAATIGAIAQSAEIWLAQPADSTRGADDALDDRYREKVAELQRQLRFFRAIRPAAAIENRYVIVVDDHVVSGATMIAALKTVRSQRPRHLTAAVPVVPQARLSELRSIADEVVHLLSPLRYTSTRQFYRQFDLVDEETCAALLRHAYATGA